MAMVKMRINNASLCNLTGRKYVRISKAEKQKDRKKGVISDSI